MEKIGVLRIVAGTGGIQLEGEGKWINPANDDVKKNLEKYRELKGKNVKVILENGKYIDIIETNEKSNIISNSAKSTRAVGKKQTNDGKEKLKKILEYIRDNSIRDWIIKLHNKDDNTIPTMGLKSDDDFLKELGFYEHVPIDRHIKRFLFRTGIIHWYFKEKSEKGEDISKLFNNNVGSYRLFQEIMIAFCKEFCGDITIYGLKLSENP